MSDTPDTRSGPLVFLATQRIELRPDANHPAVDISFYEAPPAPPTAPAAAPGPQAAPVASQAPPATVAPRPIAQASQVKPTPPPSGGKATGSSPSRKGWVWMIGGVAVFGALVLGLAVFGVLRHINSAVSHTAAAGAASDAANGTVSGAAETATAASLQTEPPRGPTDPQRQAVMENILQRLPGQIEQQGAQANADPLFQAALKGAQCKEIVFGNDSIRVTLLLPDPMKLESLGIEPYQPQTDAQAYIQRSYAGLLAAVGAMQDRTAYGFDVYYQMQPNGNITYDITLPMLSFQLYDYSDAFGPHMDEYIERLGFYTAAQEVLLPDFQDWDAHRGADRDSPALGAYFDSLAAALSDKGINLYSNVTVNTADIKAALETRLKGAWLCEDLKFTHAADGYCLSLRFPNDFMYFSGIADKLVAQYRAGELKAPSGPAELEALFTQEVRAQTNRLLEDSPQSRSDMMLQGQYRFDWETLGKRGLAACPDLVETVRHFIDGYDFHLHYFAMTAGISD